MPESSDARRMNDTLAAMKSAHARSRPVPAQLRIDRLRRIGAMIREFQGRMCEAAVADFGARHPVQTRMELLATIETAKHAVKHVGSWMKPERVAMPLPLRLTGARAKVYPQPLGVIGVLSPWNFPYNLTLAPLVGIFAAGNVAMIKPSELGPACSGMLAEALAQYFDASEVTCFLGGPDVARAFSGLPFDHLLFTGSPAIGKHVMRAAADNLVPVTLELGGKCPVIVDHDADLTLVAKRVALGNSQNAGQICLSPDTLWVPYGLVDALIAALRKVVGEWFSVVPGNSDYVGMIDERAFARVSGYLEEARASGARVEPLIGPDIGIYPNERKIAPAVVVDPDGGLAISREEIFGPLMLLRPYSDLAEVIDHLDHSPRPLALYYFGKNHARARLLQERTISGGMTINDVISHASVEDAPLGGVGNSGMGAYHGKTGFDTFSHRKTIYTQGLFSPLGLFAPPYAEKHRRLLDRMMGPVAPR